MENENRENAFMMQPNEMQSVAEPLWSDSLQVLRPKRRTLLDGFADASDFRTRPLERQDFRALWQSASRRLTPYCLDPTRQQVIFVETGLFREFPTDDVQATDTAGAPPG